MQDIYESVFKKLLIRKIYLMISCWLPELQEWQLTYWELVGILGELRDVKFEISQ